MRDICLGGDRDGRGRSVCEGEHGANEYINFIRHIILNAAVLFLI